MFQVHAMQVLLQQPPLLQLQVQLRIETQVLSGPTGRKSMCSCFKNYHEDVFGVSQHWPLQA